MLTLTLRVPPSGKGAAELGQREQRVAILPSRASTLCQPPSPARRRKPAIPCGGSGLELRRKYRSAAVGAALSISPARFFSVSGAADA
jgi:hypothetical protein